jgi:hypothetical protein
VTDAPAALSPLPATPDLHPDPHPDVPGRVVLVPALARAGVVMATPGLVLAAVPRLAPDVPGHVVPAALAVTVARLGHAARAAGATARAATAQLYWRRRAEPRTTACAADATRAAGTAGAASTAAGVSLELVDEGRQCLPPKALLDRVVHVLADTPVDPGTRGLRTRHHPAALASPGAPFPRLAACLARPARQDRQRQQAAGTGPKTISRIPHRTLS